MFFEPEIDRKWFRAFDFIHYPWKPESKITTLKARFTCKWWPNLPLVSQFPLIHACQIQWNHQIGDTKMSWGLNMAMNPPESKISPPKAWKQDFTSWKQDFHSKMVTIKFSVRVEIRPCARQTTASKDASINRKWSRGLNCKEYKVFSTCR